jgi:hypothetical protein
VDSVRHGLSIPMLIARPDRGIPHETPPPPLEPSPESDRLVRA